MTNQQVGDAIRRRREALKLSMRAAAKHAGVSPTTWSDLEGGRTPPSLATQRGVAQALDWPLNWYEQLPGDRTATNPSVEERLAAIEARLTALEAERKPAEGVAELDARRKKPRGGELRHAAKGGRAKGPDKVSPRIPTGATPTEDER